MEFLFHGKILWLLAYTIMMNKILYVYYKIIFKKGTDQEYM